MAVQQIEILITLKILVQVDKEVLHILEVPPTLEALHNLEAHHILEVLLTLVAFHILEALHILEVLHILVLCRDIMFEIQIQWLLIRAWV